MGKPLKHRPPRKRILKHIHYCNNREQAVEWANNAQQEGLRAHIVGGEPGSQFRYEVWYWSKLPYKAYVPSKLHERILFFEELLGERV